MAIESVNGYSSASTSTESRKTVTATNDLGKDAFLQILVTQMSNQDPLNPTSDTEFIAQMAQFSTLEQMQNMNAAMEMQTAYSFLGKDITASFASSSDGSVYPKEVYGKVLGISHYNGGNYLQVEDYNTGEMVLVAPDQVLQTIDTGTSTLEAQLSQLIGLMGQVVINTTPSGEQAAGESAPDSGSGSAAAGGEVAEV